MSRSSNKDKVILKSLVGAPHLPLALSTNNTLLLIINDDAPTVTAILLRITDEKSPSILILEGPAAAHQHTPTAAHTSEPSPTSTSLPSRSVNHPLWEVQANA